MKAYMCIVSCVCLVVMRLDLMLSVYSNGEYFECFV